jgi:SAM-dependent methyltransferase
MTQLASNAEIEACLRGERLYGDDFSAEQISRWYDDEKEGYADLGAKDSANYTYPYHAINIAHGFARLPKDKRFKHALGFGAAYGEELSPLIEPARRIDRITIMDPSDAFVRDNVKGVPATWVKPQPSGDIPFADASVDLITCFAVLHHVPNVSHVVKEFSRILMPGGYALIREPCVSMGDWRQPRQGLTKHERGIPLPVFRKIIADAGLTVAQERPVVFRPWVVASNKMGVWPFNSTWSTHVDGVLSRLFAWNRRYHATGLLDKFRASAVYVMLRK